MFRGLVVVLATAFTFLLPLISPSLDVADILPQCEVSETMPLCDSDHKGDGEGLPMTQNPEEDASKDTWCFMNPLNIKFDIFPNGLVIRQSFSYSNIILSALERPPKA